MSIDQSKKYYKAGTFFLLITLLLISFPRSWSLYPLGFFLFTGLLIWIKYFYRTWDIFKRYLFLIVPSIIYFLLHLISIIVQSGSVTLLTDRLMFLLVPIFGLPIFANSCADDDIKLFKTFIYGILLVTIVLIIRIIIFVNRLVPDDMTYLEYAIFNKYWFFSAHLSVFEHPTYFSMKIIWVLQLLMILHKALKINNTITILTSIFLSVFLFFTASRAAIIFWLIIVFYYIIKVYVKYNKIRFIVILTIPAIIFLVFISLEKNGRINDSISELETKLSDNNFHWKNLDQRTREWYNSMQLIKKEPLTGVGFVMVNERMKEEYYKNGFYEEANLNLNAHNQFLEAQMTFGIAGTLSLLLMLLTPLVFRKRLRYPHLTTGFILMFSFFLMFESMFNRQWGIMFFLLFYFILSVPNPEKEDNIAPDRPLL